MFITGSFSWDTSNLFDALLRTAWWYTSLYVKTTISEHRLSFLLTMIWIHFSDWVMSFNNNINIIFTWRIKKFFLFLSFRSYSFTYHLDFSAFWALNCWIFCYLPSCFRFSNCLLFFFVACRELAKSHGMALQITVNKIYLTQAFFNVLNEICPVLVTLVLGNTL